MDDLSEPGGHGGDRRAPATPSVNRREGRPDVDVLEAPVPARRGRPRSDRAHQAILDAARDQIVEVGFVNLRLEHVATRAGVGKATIYRRWPSKEALALELLLQLAAAEPPMEAVGEARPALIAVVDRVVRSLNETPYGPVIRALLSQIAVNPPLADPFRAVVVEARRDEVARILQQGIERGELRPDLDAGVATELLVGPVYYRLMFGGELDHAFSVRVVHSVLRGLAAADVPADAPPAAGPG